jgi:hypothetical protein
MRRSIAARHARLCEQQRDLTPRALGDEAKKICERLDDRGVVYGDERYILKDTTAYEKISSCFHVSARSLGPLAALDTSNFNWAFSKVYKIPTQNNIRKQNGSHFYYLRL